MRESYAAVILTARLRSLFPVRQILGDLWRVERSSFPN